MAEPTAVATLPDTRLLALLATPGTALPLPYARDVLLLECHVAGTSYRDVESVEPQLEIGQELALRREPDNPYDALAIRVQTADGTHLGYVPRRRNEVLARLLDAGKLIVARLVAKAWNGEWLRLDVQLLLRE